MPVIVDEHTQYMDIGGKPLVDGKVFIGVVNQDPTVPQDIFSDPALTVPLANPQPLNGRGQTVSKIYVAGRYSFKLEDFSGSQIEQDLDRGSVPAIGITVLTNIQGTDDITASANNTIAAYVDKAQFSLTIINSPTGATTLNIDGLGAIAIKNKDVDILPSQLLANGIIVVAFNIIGPVFELVSGANLSVPPPIGDTTPNTVKATTFEGDASGGTTINKFSIDGNLSGNSDDAVPTEQAVKTFINSTNVANQVEMEAATNITVKVTPGRQKFHPGSAKAWALYNQITNSISQSYNVSSITDNAIGDFTINFITAFSNSNYAGVYGNGVVSNAGLVLKENSSSVTRTTTAIRLEHEDQGGSRFDGSRMSASFFGDQS